MEKNLKKQWRKLHEKRSVGGLLTLDPSELDSQYQLSKEEVIAWCNNERCARAVGNLSIPNAPLQTQRALSLSHLALSSDLQLTHFHIVT